MTREEAKKYIEDKHHCDVITIDGVELIPLYQVIDRLEQPAPALDRIKEAREEIEQLRLIGYATVDGKRAIASRAVLQVLDKLIAEVEGKDATERK